MLIESQNCTTNSKYPFSQERRVACGIILNKKPQEKVPVQKYNPNQWIITAV